MFWAASDINLINSIKLGQMKDIFPLTKKKKKKKRTSGLEWAGAAIQKQNKSCLFLQAAHILYFSWFGNNGANLSGVTLLEKPSACCSFLLNWVVINGVGFLRCNTEGCCRTSRNVCISQCSTCSAEILMRKQTNLGAPMSALAAPPLRRSPAPRGVLLPASLG